MGPSRTSSAVPSCGTMWGNRRFTQEDPIGIAGGLNLYGYANGDPINYSDPFGLEAFVGCRPVGGENDEDGGGAAGHCAVRVVNEELGIDITVELAPEGRRKRIYTASGDEDRTEAYGGLWSEVLVPEGMTVNEFDRAVLKSALEVSGRVGGTKYGFGGAKNSNRFIYDIITGAGGLVPQSASAGFKIAPGICGGTGMKRGSNCSGN